MPRVVVITAGVISPVVPGRVMPAGLTAGPTVKRSLPLAALAEPTAASAVCGVATIDCNGRLAEHTVMTALGWTAGSRLDIRVVGGLVLVQADPQAVFRMTRPGQLRLPATVRHWCDLTPGCRLLLIADPDIGLLVIYPPAAVTAMATQYHALVMGGVA
jgi:bifunctional DNA-binding transcriptional regulator/antitoxin component of YhaV-PrlF toxin-antitoxin module